MESVDLGFQSGVPDLPLPPQPVLQAYFVLNTSGERGPRVGTRSTLGSGCRCGLLECACQLLNALVGCLIVVLPRDSPGVCNQVKPGMQPSPFA
jgi:hypothetical protein